MQIALPRPRVALPQLRSSATPAPSPEPPAEKGFLERAGDRLKFAAGQGLLGAGFAAATYTVPFAATSALSYLVPQWAPFGGMVGNLVIGGAVGALVGAAINDRFVAAPTNRKEQDDRKITILTGAAFGAMGGFLGTAASPLATTDWAALGAFGGTMVGVSAATLGATGFAGGLWKGPRRQ